MNNIEEIIEQMFHYLSSLEDGISYNYIADILDYVVGVHQEAEYGVCDY